MPTIPPETGPPPEDADSASKGRLSKEERRELLARIERETSRKESPERVLQRAEQAFENGNRTQAERLAAQLERESPDLIGLAHLRTRLDQANRSAKQEANVKKAEDMLLRYVEERKKTAAEFALEALTEIAPDHPRLSDYRIWVRDLDKEAAARQELDGELAAGRQALQIDDLSAAERHLENLRRLDADSAAAAQLAREISQAELGQAENADIELIKQRFEAHLVTLRLPEAEQELEQLASRAVPKITLDRLKARLEEAREADRDQQELAAFEQLYEQYVRDHRWQKARDIAQQAGKRFPAHSRPSEMFNEVNRREAAERHQESILQGVASLEQFIAENKRSEAELALKILKGKIDDAQFDEFEQRVRTL